ncbi:hypothetical protein PO909_022229 [Leuciscus waleckii]
MVLAPCGWILELVSTVAPGWRTINNIPGESIDLVLQQGLWDICKTFSSSRDILCNQQDTQYFSAQIIQIARGLMLASLILNVIAFGVASAGVRCWRDTPHWTIAGVGGVLIFISGVLTIIPVAWYTHIMTTIFSTSTDIRVGYCLVLGFIGGCLEVLAGLVMSIGLCRRCDGRRPRGRPATRSATRPTDRPMPLPRVTVPRSYTSESSVPYSQKSLDDDLDFPRAKTRDRGVVNTSYSGRPYDADL